MGRRSCSPERKPGPSQLVPPTARAEGYPQQTLRGTVEILGDVVSPALEPTAWEAEDPEEGRS